MKKLVVFLFLALKFSSWSQTTIPLSQVDNHIGDSVTIVGIIYGGHALTSTGQAGTLLVLGDTVVGKPVLLYINSGNQAGFGDSILAHYFNKSVSVTGMVRIDLGVPIIDLLDPAQLHGIADHDLSGGITPDSLTTVFGSLDTYDGCSAIGQTGNPVLQSLNRQKNRYNFPLPTDLSSTISLASILVKGDDENRWSVKSAVDITGYVVEVKPGGSETCNCHVNDDTHTDTHIVMVADPKQSAGNKRMIVEVTPRLRYVMKKQGVDWSTQTLKTQLTKKWVRIKGWLFFDLEHQASAENTNPGNPQNWRATAWEVHPITSIEIIR